MLGRFADECAIRTIVPCVGTGLGRIVRAIVGSGLIASGTLAPEALAAEPPRPEVAFERLGYTDEEIAAVRAGQIVSKPRDPAVETELRAAAVMLLPVPFDDIRRGLEGNEITPLDGDLIGHGTFSAPLEPRQWDECTLTATDGDELKRLSQVEPGDAFNLSTSEIAQIRAVLSDGSLDDASLLDALSDAYRQVLQGRFASYVERGFDGLAPYDRGDGDDSDPAREMREVMEEALPFLRQEFPDFAAALEGYPASEIDGLYNRYVWDKTRVEGRPVIVLSHTLAEIGSDHILGIVRQYYVGHTYNTAQSLWLGYREGTGTLVFHINSTTTDQIKGLFSSLAQSVGKKRIRQTLESHFEKLRNHMQSNSP